MMHAEYNYKINDTFFKKYKYSSQSYKGGNLSVYKIGKKFLKINTYDGGTTMDMFRNANDYLEYEYMIYY